MKKSRIAMAVLALASIGLAGVALAPTMLPSANGQGQQNGPGGQNAGGPGNGPPRQFGRGGGRGRFGGPGGPGGRMPFAMGTVTAVDPAAKTITIASQFGGNSETIQVSDATQITSQGTATVADLKVGDHVQIEGIPTGITASSLTIGENPLAAGRPGVGGPGGNFPPAGGPGGAARRGGANDQPATAAATGAVTSTNPLTISLGADASLTLKTDSKTKVTKFTPIELAGVKVGDRITSQGQAGDNGVFTATSVGVNLQMGGPGPGFGGRGGFGMPGGFARRGGPGGGGFPGGPPQGGPFPGGPPQGGQFPGGPPQGGQFPGGPPHGGQFPGGQPAPPPAPDAGGF